MADKIPAFKIIKKKRCKNEERKKNLQKVGNTPPDSSVYNKTTAVQASVSL